MLQLAALISASGNLGYLLPAIIGLESMGIPSPGEAALITAAVLASQGKLNIWLVILIAAASAIIGDNIGYELGRRLGRQVLESPGPFQKHRKQALAAGDGFFNRHGTKAVFLGRWVAIVRIAAAWLAGIDRMPYLQFFVWNALGGITWAIAFGLAGYFGGTAAAHVIERVGIYAAIVAGVLLVVGFLGLRVRERRKRRAELNSAAAGSSAAGPDGPPASGSPPAPPPDPAPQED